jgi:hypothetical protein
MNNTTLEAGLSNPDNYKREFRQKILGTLFGSPCRRITQIGSCVSSAARKIFNVACWAIYSVGSLFEQASECLVSLAKKACSCLRGGKIEEYEEDVDIIPIHLRILEKRPSRTLRRITLKTKETAVADDTSSEGEVES